MLSINKQLSYSAESTAQKWESVYYNNEFTSYSVDGALLLWSGQNSSYFPGLCSPAGQADWGAGSRNDVGA